MQIGDPKLNPICATASLILPFREKTLDSVMACLRAVARSPPPLKQTMSFPFVDHLVLIFILLFKTKILISELHVLKVKSFNDWFIFFS